jgi:hypothetical protein
MARMSMWDKYPSNCPICKDWCGPESTRIAKGRAAKTAHALAKEKADAGMPGLDWLDVYMVFFPKIYIHELKRNLTLERQLELTKSVERNQNHPDVCEYHWENVMWFRDGTNAKVTREVQKEYDESKWPNKLGHYADNRIKLENL